MQLRQRLTVDRLVRAGFVAGIVALFFVLLRSTWLAWGDPIIDTGRELEIPWKIAAGKMLYRDMAYNYGPLSPSFHALLFKLFGVRLIVVVWSGVLAAAAGAVLVWRVSRTLADRVAACAITAVFLLECAFQHDTPNGIFNFVLPYSFPAVHGMLLALGAWLALSSWIDRGGRARLAVAGALVGLSILCKVEVAFAIVVPLALVPLIADLNRGQVRRDVILDQAAWAGPCALVAAGGFLPFVLGSSFDVVVWRNVLRPQLADFRSNLFFMMHLGLADLPANLRRIGLGLAGWTAAAALVGAGSTLMGRREASQRGARLAAGTLVLLATVAAAWFWLPHELEFAGLSAVALTVSIVYGWRVATGAASPEPRSLRLFALALLGTLALFRMFMTAGTFHYGFCLAVPALILLGVTLCSELPRLLPALGRAEPWFGPALACLLVALSCRNFLTESRLYYRQRTVELRGARGTMWISSEPYGVTPGEYLASALARLQSSAREGDTLLVLPEGATINFLSGQMNPTYYDTLIPPELEAPGVEDALIEQIERARVTRILFVERNVSEYGRRGLGVDYGMKLARYIRERYVMESTFGPPLYGEEPGGCAVLRRRDSS